MSNSKGVTEPNKQYQQLSPFVMAVRDVVAGETVVKSPNKASIYLPHPCPDMKDARERDLRFKRYLLNAEFDDIAGNTLDSLVGSIFKQEPNYDGIPERLRYLEDNSDGDDLSLNELLKISAAELLQMKYVLLLAEYNDLSGVDIQDISVEQARNMQLQASIKAYNRDSLINWQFSKVNGKLQLSMAVLRECENVRETGSFETVEYKSYLVLGLDKDGYYYQQKYIEKGEGDGEWSDVYYPIAAGQRLNYIPAEICIATDCPKGQLPKNLGYIAPIASKALHRYRTSADMKESMWLSGAPITSSSGWDEQAFEMYKNMTGKEYISQSPGSHVPLPEGAEFNIHSWNMGESSYADYMDRNEREIRALGGQYDTSDGVDQETATAAVIRAAEKSGVLTQLVGNLEKSINRVIGYCGVFMGVTEQPEVKLGREFSMHKLTAQDRAAILNEWQTGLIGDEEALKQLSRGGVLVSDVDDLLNMAQNQGDAGGVA